MYFVRSPGSSILVPLIAAHRHSLPECCNEDHSHFARHFAAAKTRLGREALFVMMWLIGGKLGAILIFTLLSGSEGRRAEQGRGCAFLPSTWQSPRRECGARPSPFIEAGTRIRGCRSGHRLHCCQMAMGRLVQGCGKRRVAIVGGGLAGLSVAYHLLNMTRTTGSPSLSITIMDEFVSLLPRPGPY